jgi:hypothetical protein
MLRNLVLTFVKSDKCNSKAVLFSGTRTQLAAYSLRVPVCTPAVSSKPRHTMQVTFTSNCLQLHKNESNEMYCKIMWRAREKLFELNRSKSVITS